MRGDVFSPKVGIPSMLSGLCFSTAHVFSSTVAHALVYLNDTPHGCMAVPSRLPSRAVRKNRRSVTT